jgi:hypothetical protein
MDDPMLKVVRERHPEVDIVVLPQPAPPAAPEAGPDRLEALAADVDRSFAELLDRVVPDPAPSGKAVGTTVGVRWHEDEWGLTWYEASAVVGPLTRGDNVALLRATGAALVELGWRARPVPGDRPRLEGRRRGGLEAFATVRPESLVVTLRTVRVRPVQEVAS